MSLKYMDGFNGQYNEILYLINSIHALWGKLLKGGASVYFGQVHILK